MPASGVVNAFEYEPTIRLSVGHGGQSSEPGAVITWRKILERDDTKVAVLEQLYQENRARARFVPEVVSLLEQLDDAIAWRALWLLHRAAEDGPIPEAELVRVAEMAGAFNHWAWRLLLCQLFGTLACPPRAREELFPFLQDCFSDRRVIVRAWALSAMWFFRHEPEFKGSISRCLRVAQRDPGKAMQARLRQLGRMKRANSAANGSTD